MCFFFEVWISRKKDQQHIELANPDKMKSYASRIFAAASSQTKRVWLQPFLWSSSRENRNLLSKSLLLHREDLDHPEMCFVSPIGGPFHEQKKTRLRQMIINSKNHIYQCEFSPNKAWHMFGTNLEVKHRPTKIKNPIWTCFFPTSCNFHFVFLGSPWKSNKLRWQFRCWWCLGLKNRQTKPERGSKTHAKTPRAVLKPKKTGGKFSENSPPPSCEDFP